MYFVAYLELKQTVRK